MAGRYRKNPAAASKHMLMLLGIADPSYRSSFVTLSHVLDHITHFDGSIIECGVYRGSTLLGMAHRLALRGIHDVKLIGCDSFEGFPAPSQEDALTDGTYHEAALQGSFKDTSYDLLQKRVASLGFADRIQLEKGFFENTLPNLSEMRFSLAHLDCDLYQSYVTCLEFLYPRMVCGGYMVFDEYDFSAPVYPGAQKAIDEFFANKPEKLQRFPDLAAARCFIVKE
jgi:O-methyltransferase